MRWSRFMLRRHSTLEPATHVVTTSRLTCLIRGCTRKTAFDRTNAIKEQREDWEKKMTVNGIEGRSQDKEENPGSGGSMRSDILACILSPFSFSLSIPFPTIFCLSVCLSVFFTLSLCLSVKIKLQY